ncbi:hypothetical protein QBC37DRAFT_279289 [Rhypophila decipiens]|uniref:F-box domain-containing protein n=1 Tax=Rhypophila decipiens TaxID=261697 RepID=A0AAN6YEA5_9PEZI|nr:hypothetical protein QBC37DRAFT_279289 [Rhypophila decipiens]
MSLPGNGTGSLADNVRNSISTLASHNDRGKCRTRDKDMSLEMAFPVPSINNGAMVPDDISGPPGRVLKPLTLLNLPPELQIMVLRHLEFADIERLRRTCKYLRALASPTTVRTIMGHDCLRSQLMGHCHACLLRDPFRARLLLGNEYDAGWPLNSMCIKCAMKSNDKRIRVGRKVMLGSRVEVWVCRWCGVPVTEGAAAGNEQFHRRCYQSYNLILVFFFLLGWLQFSLGIIASALAWRWWRFTPMVFGPTLASFILLWVVLVMLIFRGNKVRTYQYTWVLEFIILGLWGPPIYYLAHDIAAHPEMPVPKYTQAALAMFGLNALFRLVNVLGNTVLFFGYEITKTYRPGAPLWRKIVNPTFAFLIFWTYPQALERRRPVISDSTSQNSADTLSSDASPV